MPSTRDRDAPASERVVLVNADDAEVGTAEKLEAHRMGHLHRAFSVFVFDSAGAMLLQRRAAGKYHSAGRWSNACCGHPRPGEDTGSAARRRLWEEMGLDCPLTPVIAFTYRAELGEGLVENEYDHVFVGWVDGDPHPDPSEADAWCWAPIGDLQWYLRRHPERFSAWFAIALGHLLGPASGLEDVPEDDPLYIRRADSALREE